MKKIYFSILSLTISIGAFAQMQLENPGFEGWDNTSTDTREPQQWSSIKTGGGNATQPSGFVVNRSTVVRSGTSGTYSAVVETKTLTVFGFIQVDVNGILTNGRVEAPTTTPSDGYNRTKPDDEEFKTSFIDYPDTLVAWVNYEPVGNDNGRIQCVIHNVINDGLNSGEMGSLPENGSSQGDNTAQTITKAEVDLIANTSGWIRLAIPFNYINGSSPEYILVTATSSIVAGGGEPESKLYLDDFGLIYNITPVLGSSTVDVSTLTSASLNVDYSTGGTPTAPTNFVVELSDENGSFVSPDDIGTEVSTNLSSGTIACTVPEGTVAGTGYKVRVTNVSEFYASIEVPLTITNLTVGIAGISNDNIHVYGTNGNVTVDLTNSAVGQSSYELISLNGQRVATGSLVSGSINTLSNLNSGIYAVRVIHAEGMFTKKVLVN
jgi:hypothetical protein